MQKKEITNFFVYSLIRLVRFALMKLLTLGIINVNIASALA